MPRGGFISDKPRSKAVHGKPCQRYAECEDKKKGPRSKPAPRNTLGGWFDECVEAQLGKQPAGSVREAAPAPAQQEDMQPVSVHRDVGRHGNAVDALGPTCPVPLTAQEQLRMRYATLNYARQPHYAWLEQKHEKPVHVQAWSKSEAPASPSSVIDSDVTLRDEPVEVVIVGGGPHALAVLAALNEGSLKKDVKVCVIDPGSHFMQAWNTRFETLEITHLRSPAIAHPVAFDPTALVDFAVGQGRTSELIDAPVTGSWLVSTDVDREQWLKALPSNALFRDFCASLAARLPHRWASGAACGVSKDAGTGQFHVRYKTTADGRDHVVAARALVLATGPVGKWNVPAPFAQTLDSRLVLHTEELLLGKGTLSEEITCRCPSESGRVLVVGGGISAAQAALAAVRAGHHVVLRSRRPLQTRPFDIDHGWFDMRKADRMRFEFLCLPMNQRRNAVRDAQSGGSVPATYMRELRRLSQVDGDARALTLEVDGTIDRSEVRVDGDSVAVNGERFAMVILATGVVTAPSCGDSSPLYHSVKELLKAPAVEGLPRVGSTLRWVAREDVFVVGANAVLELGPGGGNLMGAMRGARVISNELHGLLCLDAAGAAASAAAGDTARRVEPSVVGARVQARLRANTSWYAGVVTKVHADGSCDVKYDDGDFEAGVQPKRVRPDQSRAVVRPAQRAPSSNQYVSLGDRVRFGDGCDAEIDFLAQQLHLSPQAEVALRRACGATKGCKTAFGGKKGCSTKATPYLKGAPVKGALKGELDPMGALAPRTKWATYW